MKKSNPFGEYLARIREKSGYKSQRQLALDAGISPATLSRIEAGTQQPTPDTLKLLAKFLKDVSYEELMVKAGYLDIPRAEKLSETFKQQIWGAIQTLRQKEVHELDMDMFLPGIPPVEERIMNIFYDIIHEHNEILLPEQERLAQKMREAIAKKKEYIEKQIAFLNHPQVPKPTGNSQVPDLPGDFYPVGELKYIPIVAEIPCGEPIYTEENVQGYMPVDTSIVNVNSGEYVWLKAKGDSMIDANIFDGSLVLVRLQPTVDSGEIAAVCVDDENATLKRVIYAGDSVVLIPENQTMRPMTYEKHRIRVVGKMIAVFLMNVK